MGLGLVAPLRLAARSTPPRQGGELGKALTGWSCSGVGFNRLRALNERLSYNAGDLSVF